MLCNATSLSFVFVIQFVFCVGGLKCSFPSLEDNNYCGVHNYVRMELERYVNSQDFLFFEAGRRIMTEVRVGQQWDCSQNEKHKERT